MLQLPANRAHRFARTKYLKTIKRLSVFNQNINHCTDKHSTPVTLIKSTIQPTRAFF